MTWKLDKVPLINKGFVAINKQPNHRLVWLSRIQYELSNNRGIVKRIDHGTFIYISRKSDLQELKFLLNGTLMNGLFVIEGHICQLRQKN